MTPTTGAQPANPLPVGAQTTVDWALIDRIISDSGIGGPVVVLDKSAFEHNVADLHRRARSVPIRVASKSLRVRSVIEDILSRDGFAGVLAYDLNEAIWLATASGISDVLMGYPTTNRAAITALAADDVAVARVTLLIDSVDQLDLIDDAVPASHRPALRVAVDLDASLDLPVLGHIGVLRSPIHTPDDARTLAQLIVARAGFTLVGVMSYEAQVAGVGNSVGRSIIRNRMVTQLHRRSMVELIGRRMRAVAAISELADLEFVNAGGTGSLEATASDPSVTDIAAGSGFFGGHLFDGYAHFTPAPAVSFGLDVVRRPRPGVVTCHGGGWIASGPPDESRLPVPVWPPGLRYAAREAAGEVQTPLIGAAADSIPVGSRVWFRHTKSGEVSEHCNEIVIVDRDQAHVVDSARTYRGEGRCFL